MEDESRVCAGCGGQIKRPGRADQRYHDAGCRMRAKRARDLASTPLGPRPPLRPQIERTTMDLRRVVERLEGLAEDDRFRKAVAYDRPQLAALADRIRKAVTT